MRSKDAAKALRDIKLALIAVPILAMVISAVISLFILSPVYKTSATLMVFKQPEVAVPYEVRVGTITLNQRLVKSYSELAKSTIIYEEVIKQNDLKMSVEELKQSVDIELLGDTEFLRISVENSNPTLTAMLANEMSRVLMEKVAELMNLDNLQVVDAASPPQKPISPNQFLNILLAGVLGLILVVGVALFRASIRASSEDVSQDTHFAVQPVIPKEPIAYPSGEKENYENDESTSDKK